MKLKLLRCEVVVAEAAALATEDERTKWVQLFNDKIKWYWCNKCKNVLLANILYNIIIYEIIIIFFLFDN